MEQSISIAVCVLENSHISSVTASHFLKIRTLERNIALHLILPFVANTRKSTNVPVFCQCLYLISGSRTTVKSFLYIPDTDNSCTAFYIPYDVISQSAKYIGYNISQPHNISTSIATPLLISNLQRRLTFMPLVFYCVRPELNVRKGDVRLRDSSHTEECFAN